MARIGKMVRRFNKREMEKLYSGAGLVSDRETQKFEDDARDQAQAGLQAQQKMLNRAAEANKAGSPVVAGVIKSAAKDVAKQSADAGIKATGQAQKFSEALKEQRKAAILNNAKQQVAQNREALGMTLDSSIGMSGVMADFKK